MCNHTEFDECKCPCHELTEDGQPKIIHMIACCDPCPECGRNVDKQIDGFTS